MIGLSFLAVGLIWLALSWTLVTRLPKWLSIKRPLAQWSLRALLLLLLLIGPFVDHIVGMWQFDNLCAEETRLWVSPNAGKTKRGKGLSGSSELMKDYFISIKRTKKIVIDLDTNEVIARYNYFATHGGRFGPLLSLGGEQVCSVTDPRHVDNGRFLALKNQVSLTYAEAK